MNKDESMLRRSQVVVGGSTLHVCSYGTDCTSSRVTHPWVKYLLQVAGSCFSRASDSPRHTHEDHRERATVHTRTSFLLKPLVIYSMNYAADVEANTQNSPYSFNGIFHSISGLQIQLLRRTYQTNPAMVMA